MSIGDGNVGDVNVGDGYGGDGNIGEDRGVDAPVPSASPDGRRKGRRRLSILVVTALAGAGCCAGAAGISWWTAAFADSLAGTVHTAAKGSELLPELVPVALVALAGLGATFATRGTARRLVGVLVAAGGLLVLIRAALSTGQEPTTVLTAALTRPATETGDAARNLAGPVLALAGGLLVIVSGLLVATGPDLARRMGSAYDAPARRREQALRRARELSAGSGQASATVGEPAELWRAMDAGADPTEPAAPGGTAAPGHRGGPGADTITPPGRPDAAGAVPLVPRDSADHREPSDVGGPPPPGIDEETTG